MYKCECGREFENAQAFNGHKSHCKTHMHLTNKIEQLEIAESRRHQHAKVKFSINRVNMLKNKKEALNKWVSEKHKCEHCGKVMTEKFGSGRFCCRACANARKYSDKTKEKISIKLAVATKNAWKDRRENNIKKYLQNPNYCSVCGKQLSYEKRFNKTCSEKCYKKYLSNKTKAAVIKNGGNLNSFGVKGTAKYGTYRGFTLDSSYELAFVVYCLEHNIEVTRNTKGFEYYINNEKHLYYPDFIVNNTYIEIKNYHTEQVQAKIDYFPKDLQYKIIYKKDMKKYLNYVQNKYGTKFWDILYEK